MKKRFIMSNDDLCVWNDLAKRLDEVYDQPLSLKEDHTHSLNTFKNKKHRIPLVNKHSLDQHKDKNNNNNNEFDELHVDQPFNVLPLYKKREKDVTSRYLHHGDFTEADGHITKRIRRRQASIQAETDLHNMTQKEAQRALNNFVISSSKNKYKMIRVITGKGKGGVGVIRANIDKWLNMHPIRSLILGFDYAHKSDGGMGAINILLRR